MHLRIRPISKNYTYAQIAEKLNENHYLTLWHKQFDGKAFYSLIKRDEMKEINRNFATSFETDLRQR